MRFRSRPKFCLLQVEECGESLDLFVLGFERGYLRLDVVLVHAGKKHSSFINLPMVARTSIF